MLGIELHSKTVEKVFLNYSRRKKSDYIEYINLSQLEIILNISIDDTREVGSKIPDTVGIRSRQFYL